MKFESTVTIHLDKKENEAWEILYTAISKLAFEPCADVETAKAVYNFFEAMQYFAHYIEN